MLDCWLDSTEGGCVDGYVVLGRAGYEFTAEDEELLRLIVLPQLVRQHVDVESIVCEDDRFCLRFTLGTAEAKLKLLAMPSLAYTDQITITFEDPLAKPYRYKTYPVLVTVRDIQHLTWPCVAPQSLIGLRPFTDYIWRRLGLRSNAVFEKVSVARDKELKLTLNCRSAKAANRLLEVGHGVGCDRAGDTATGDSKSYDDQWFYGSTISFYEPGLRVFVEDDCAKKILCEVEPHIGSPKAMIKRAMDVRVSVVKPDSRGEVLLTVDTPEDYDVLVHGKKRMFAGQTINFAPKLCRSD